MHTCLSFNCKYAFANNNVRIELDICNYPTFKHLTYSRKRILSKFSLYLLSVFLVLRKYSCRNNNCKKIWPAHSMISKRDFILRDSCLCEKCIEL